MVIHPLSKLFPVWSKWIEPDYKHVIWNGQVFWMFDISLVFLLNWFKKKQCLDPLIISTFNNQFKEARCSLSKPMATPRSSPTSSFYATKLLRYTLPNLKKRYLLWMDFLWKSLQFCWPMVVLGLVFRFTDEGVCSYLLFISLVCL